MAALKDDLADMKVTMADFENALDDVKPAFGVDDEALSRAFERGIIPYSPLIQDILDEGMKYSNIVSDLMLQLCRKSTYRFRVANIEQVTESGSSSVTSVLLFGPQSCGTTALAAKMAVDSGCPLVKVVSADKMTGLPDAAKVAYLEKTFSDAHKSRSSIIILDSLERLFSWVPIGPRFSMMLVDALLVYLNKQPPAGRRLLVFATSSIPDVLKELSFSFSREIEVQPVASAEEVQTILQQYGQLSQNDAAMAMRMYGRNEVGVGIKKILSAIERAKVDEDVPRSFARLLQELVRREHGAPSPKPGRDLRWVEAAREPEEMPFMYKRDEMYQ